MQSYSILSRIREDFQLLALGAPLGVISILRHLGIAQDRYIDARFVSGAVVSRMVYVVMPRYTKLIQRWLFE